MSRSRDRLASEAALAQSARCTDTPRPWVTKPTISSPGHRRAAPGQPDHHVVETLDVDADGRAPARAGAVGCWRAVIGSCSS